VEGRLSRGIIVTITLVAALLLILNVVLISCYVRRRNAARKEQMQGKQNKGDTINATFCFQGFFALVPSQRDHERPELPLVVVLSVTAAVTVLLLCVTVIVACVWRHKQRVMFLSRKCGDYVQSCCCKRLEENGKEETKQPTSGSTSEGKASLNKGFFRGRLGWMITRERRFENCHFVKRHSVKLQ